MRNYQKKKKELSKQVFDILDNRGYLMWKEIKKPLQGGEAPTTFVTNFNTISEARELLRSFPEMEEISVNYDDFTIFTNRILFTVKPRITEKIPEITEDEPNTPPE
ncbi:hypothetical protein [Dysgonomonas sp. GY617]|uniref:hypothetical protein n=1 Tax=Dysgonomonas sp. GY617 TaxID=2780420 RepID=UPI001884265E|nr:hypothetical protein [Dysgonomonas sp. GY617]MBF0575506.1 hypothetical protein [Dysgonomonas sp. GY617]